MECRGRASGSHKSHASKLDKQVGNDFIAENQRSKAENGYLKNLRALVLKDGRRQHKKTMVIQKAEA